MKIILAGIVEDSIVDGPGLRTTFFTQGCPHRCEGCHNPQTFPFEGGSAYAAEELAERVKNNPLASGVTFSGGEPFCQAEALLPFAKTIRDELKREIAIYSGYTFEEILNLGEAAVKFLATADVLVDGRFVLGLKSLGLKFKGSSNQRVIDVQKSLERGTVVLEVS